MTKQELRLENLRNEKLRNKVFSIKNEISEYLYDELKIVITSNYWKILKDVDGCETEPEKIFESSLLETFFYDILCDILKKTDIQFFLSKYCDKNTKVTIRNKYFKIENE